MKVGIWQSGCTRLWQVNEGQPRSAAGTMKQQRGFSLIELLIVVAIILIIASIAIPSLINTKIVANEAAAVASLNTVRSAEAAYIASYPEVGFADSLERLGPPTQGNPDAAHAGLIDEVLATKKAKSGYAYSIAGVKAESSPIVNGYAANASPQSTTTGKRSFCMNETGVVRQQAGGTACDPAASAPVQ
jgi:type IV pilus assembly protein PilA